MVLSFEEELSSSATVEVLLSNPTDNEEVSTDKIAATRVNPYTYTFNAPSGQQLSLTGLPLFRVIYCIRSLFR